MKNVHAAVTLLIVATTTLAAVPAARAQTTTTVKLATLVPDGSVWDKLLHEMGADWQKSTQGRVSLLIYAGGTVGDEPDLVRMMRIGRLQAAALTTAGLAKIDPSFQIFNIPMYFDSYDELNDVIKKMEPTLKQRLEAKGFVLLSWGHGGWVHFFSRKPIATVEDVKKAKIFSWAGDDQSFQLWKGQGYQPVALAATDILTGLNTGMIDVFPSTPVIAMSMQWFRVAPYMAEIGLAPLAGGMVMTKQAWAKLSEADRAKILEASGRLERRLQVEIPKQDTTSVAVMQQRGLKIVPVDAANIAAWHAAAKQFAEKMRGPIVPADVLDMATKERDAYRQQHGTGSAH